jgi:MerR family redox-sensitive transcriptional activator SoxR
VVAGIPRELSIGEVARRADVSVPTVRFYEARGLISSVRTSGNQRRFPRHVLRRLAFVAAAQRVGLSLAEISASLATLPADRAPTRREWTRLSAGWQRAVGDRIAQLQALQDTLDGCIGCGCLSLRRCALYNAGDAAAAEGAGSRWLRRAQAASGRVGEAPSRAPAG